jgi:integrase
MKLTTKNIIKLSAPKVGHRIYSDNGMRGLGLRVTAAGSRAWTLNYTARGQQRRATLGAYPAMSLMEARATAASLRASGIDPLAEKQTRREEESSAPTVTRLSEIWTERHAKIHKRPSSVTNDLVNLKKHILPRLGLMKVADVKRADIEALMGDMSDIPIQANRALSLLTTLMRYATSNEYRTSNPCARIKRFPENQRFVELQRDDLNRLYAALDRHPNRRAANAVRLLLWTGARRAEILGARWTEFDLDRRLWTRPAIRVKQKRLSTIHLSDLAIELLRTMHAEANSSDYLFPGDAPGKPLRDIKKFWRIILKQAGIPSLRLHDLRHVFGTAAIESGVPLDALAPLLGHSSTVITKTYANWSAEALRIAAGTAARALAPPS